MTLTDWLLVTWLVGALPWSLGWGWVAIHRMTGGRWSNDPTPVRMVAYTMFWPVVAAAIVIKRLRPTKPS